MGTSGEPGSSSWSQMKQRNNVHSDSSDSDEEVAVSTTFTRKISTNKRLDKSLCLKEGYLQILRSTSFHKWKRRYFWLKGKTLFYGRDSQAAIYEEIDISEASVAEYTLKNVNHAFQVISSFRNFVLATDSRKDMESWIQAIVHSSQQKFYDPNDQQSMISGQHSWYITSHARPVYCNVCREALPGVTSHGLSCGVCKYKAHKRCAIRAPNNCKWSTLSSVGNNIIEDGDGNLDMGHQWLEGNLPVSSHCTVCDKKCGSVRKLTDLRCLWCKATVHSTGCKDQMERRCSQTLCQYSVLCPLSIQSIDSDGLCEATKCRGGTTSPLLVFVNSKSGDNQGVKFLRKFKQLLNPAQVFDLMNGGPFPGLRLFQSYDQFRILVCGGDGSVSWVMSEMDRLNLHTKCQIGVLPLGTGNDLARVLGWGSVMTDDNQLINVIEKLEQSQIKMLDRWSILACEWKPPQYIMASGDDDYSTDEQIGAGDDTPYSQDDTRYSLNHHDTHIHMSAEDSATADIIESSTERITTYETSMAECLHKILHSQDYLSVINHSRSLCLIVSRFLSQLVELQHLSLSATTSSDKVGESSIPPSSASPLSDKCQILQSKLNRLVNALQETQELAERHASQSDSGSVLSSPEGSTDLSENPSQGTEGVTAADLQTQGSHAEVEPTEILMSRANSVKKAIKQIMEHTEVAVNLTITPHNLSLVELELPSSEHSTTTRDQPTQYQTQTSAHSAASTSTTTSEPPVSQYSEQASQADTHYTNLSDCDVASGQDSHSLAVSHAHSGSHSDSRLMDKEKEVNFTIGRSTSLESPTTTTPAGLTVTSVTEPSTPSRRISTISTAPKTTASEPSMATMAAAPQPQAKQSTSLRVRNAIASKLEGNGSFIGKLLLANADAICAPVVPPFDDRSIQAGMEEKAVMNNYVGIGIDAKIMLEFHHQREHHPERFRSRARNLMTFASLGGKEIITRTYRNFERRIRLECDGQQIPLPNLQGIVVLNIPSYSGGTNFWGISMPGSNEPFTSPSFDDKIIEVMAVYGSAHIGVSRFINLQYHRIAQCRSVKITILGSDAVPMQVDGEAWLQDPGFVMISHKNRAQMLTRDRSFEHTLRSWSERQSKEKLLPSGGAVGGVGSVMQIPETGQRSRHQTTDSGGGGGSGEAEGDTFSSNPQIQSLVQATRQLVHCLTNMKMAQVKPSEHALSKCGEFVSLDDATQAGLQELSVCSTELCAEVQEILSDYTNMKSACEESESISQLRAALQQTQSELHKFSDTSDGASSSGPHKHRHGPFRLIGKLLGRNKRGSSKSSSSSSTHSQQHPESDVSRWSTEDVGAWLTSLGLAEYSQLFIRNDIRGAELLHLQRQDLKDLGITKVGHLKRLQSALKSYS